MIRIILPVAIIFAVIFGPWFQELVVGGKTGDRIDTATGNYYISNTVDCFKDGQYSIGGDCKPQGGLEGTLIFAAVATSAVAAVLGVLGLLPFIGRFTSIFTVIAGGATIAAFLVFAANMGFNDVTSFKDIQWGAYVAGGLGLLTLLTGLGGMRS
ncbi:MAG: hypothetical protein V3V30_08205 [Parvularculaceae bacterium]